MELIERLWEMRHGFSECGLLSSTCVIDWAAVGGWAAAIATFLAVLLPFYREKRRARLRYTLTLSAYSRSLAVLAMRLHSISSARETLQTGTYAPHKTELELILEVDFQFPVLEIEPELEGVILATDKLREIVDTWRRTTQTITFSMPERVAPRKIENIAPMLDAITARLHERVEEVQAAIDRAIPYPRLGVRKRTVH